MITAVKREHAVREARIDRLVGPLRLLDVCRAACAAAGLEDDRAQVISYCIVAIADKDASAGASERERPLDLDAADAQERLAYWAQRVARNLRDWAQDFTAIQTEFDQHRITTLRRHISRYVPGRQDDAIDVIADWAGVVLAGTPPIEDLTLEEVRDEPPPGNAYIFRHPLPNWLAVLARRGRPWNMESTDVEGDEIGHRPATGDRQEDDVLVEAIAEADQERDDLLTEVVARIAAMRATRALLADVLERAMALEGALAAVPPGDADHADLLVRVRAALAYEADLLSLERRAMTGMLAYLVFAMRAAPKLQQVAVLSLRHAEIDGDAVADMATRMRALIDDGGHPTQRLLAQAEAAGIGVKRTRVDAIRVLREAPTRRDVELAPVVRLFDELPAVVADLAEIGRLTNGRPSTTSTYRSAASAELGAVDRVYDRVFRRYAMGDRA
jgi:hypothetical protein